MQLKELVQQLPTLSVEGSLDRPVQGLAYDSRRITPGMIFIAIPGRNVDGRNFIQSALDRGAAAIICESNGMATPRAAKIVVADAREALARAAAAFYQNPSRRLKMVGVTGTNGKTTVSFLIKQILEKAGIKTGLIGTVRYEIGDRVIPAQRTTPEALEIQQMLAQMRQTGCEACVMEVSSHALEQKRVMGLEYDLAVFTNLTQDHLDYHGTMEGYFKAKTKLFATLAGTSGEPAVKRGTAVINLDDPYGARLARQMPELFQIGYGVQPTSLVRAERVQLGKNGTELTIATPRGAFECFLPLIGRHNVYNALAATAAAHALMVPIASIQQALGTLQPVPGRLQRISMGQPFEVLVDYAHTDDALRNVLVTLREITPGRVLLTFGCGGNRDTGKRAKMGRVAAELADFTVITTDNPRKESLEKIAQQIEAGYRSVRAEGYRLELDRRRAIDEVIRAAGRGDSVLIAGKGHETYQEFADTIVPFDDCMHAERSLEHLGYTPAAGKAK